MFTATISKTPRRSAWASFWRVFSRTGAEKRVDINRLSAHLLRDLGMSPRDACDLLASERTRFLS